VAPCGGFDPAGPRCRNSPRGAVARPALLDHLDQAGPRQLVVVVAPAGYGKTLLLAEWVRRGGPPTAWVSLDCDDDAPRFWSAVLTALRALPGVSAAERPGAACGG